MQQEIAPFTDHRNGQELKALYRCSLAINRLSDAAEIAAEAIETVENLLNYERCAIVVVEDSDKSLRLLAHSGKNLSRDEYDAEFKRVDQLIRINSDAGIIRRVVTQGKFVNLHSVDDSSEYLCADDRVRSELCVPIMFMGRTIGAINVESFMPDAFSRHDVNLLTAVANMLAVSIENARLVENEASRNLAQDGLRRERDTLKNRVDAHSQEIARVNSERERAYTAFQDSEEKFRSLVDGSIQGICIISPERRALFVNEAYASIYGYESVDDILSLESTEVLLPPHERDRMQELRLARLRGENVPAHYEYDGLRKDGTTVRLQAIARKVTWEKQSAIQLTIFDITEIKRNEAVMSRFGRIIEDSVNEVYVFRSDTLAFTLVNRGARENLGYSMAELHGMTPVDLKPMFDRETFLKTIQPLKDGRKQVLDFETVHLRKDGTTYPVQVRLQHTRSDSPAVFFAIIQDMTERKLVEEQLRRSQKLEAIAQVTGGAAHEFNNLLMAISGNLELHLERDLKGMPDASETIENILQFTHRGKELTGRLLSYTGNPFAKSEVIDVSRHVSNAVQFLGPVLGETMSLEYNVPGDIWPICVDSVEFEGALTNLAINARDAMPDGGTITITTRNVSLDENFADGRKYAVEPGNYVSVSVSDTGTGMRPDIVERAFDPFFTTKEAGKGTGLGLSMIYGFVHRQSDGYVDIESTQGQGTTVTLYFPQSAGDVAQALPRETRNVDEKSDLTVLIVEDDPGIRELLVAMLESPNLTAICAADCAAALTELASHDHIDLLITDVILPGGRSGIDLVGHVRKNFSHIKILLISGYAEADLVAKGLPKNRYTLLSKPFRKNDLVAAIGNVFEGAHRSILGAL